MTVSPRLDQLDEFTKRMQVESDNRAALRLDVLGCSEVGPVPSDCEGAALGITQNQGGDAGDIPGLQYRKALAATRMEGMCDLRRSRRENGCVCS